MYLTCPSCKTVYTVRAAMLREGQGDVRCGACRSLFNALDYLSDELPEGVEGTSSLPDARAGTDPGPPSVAAPAVAPTSSRSDVPESLAADWRTLQHDTAAPRRNLALGVLSLVLLLALAAQYLWFEPEDLVRRYPQAAEPVARICAFAGCIAPQRRDPSQIRMLSRDVRAHPRYEGALLVTATFSNAAPWPQPFPRLHFRLYDVNGQTIASRVFTPKEYLAGTLPANAELPSGQPLQVALEMLAPEEAAVSFEFSFL